MPEQAAYDVKSYDLDLRVNPTAQSIAGLLTCRALIVHPTNRFVLDLDTVLTVAVAALVNTDGSEQPLKFERRESKLWLALPTTKQPGEEVRVRIAYAGNPRVAPRPPWVGGFVWAKTADGQPWLGVACQNDGAKVWFPSKDHPSDEPDTVSLHFTVPQPLVAASKAGALSPSLSLSSSSLAMGKQNWRIGVMERWSNAQHSDTPVLQSLVLTS